jgi:PmbA protein
MMRTLFQGLRMPADKQPSPDALTVLDDMIGRAKKAGADAADAVLSEGTSVSHAQRLGKLEKLERSEGYDLHLRVLVGKRQASASSNDRSAAALADLIERAIAMAKTVPEDPYCGLADPSELAHNWSDLDLVDPVEPTAETLIARTKIAEEAALAVPGITNSDGAGTSWGRSTMSLAASNGFAGSYSRTYHYVGVSVLAGTGTGMEVDDDYSTSVWAEDLRDPKEVGKSAGERAVERLNSRKVPTCQVPVVLDPRVAGGMLRHLIGAISGPSIARGTSFLKDKLKQRIFPARISIIDDPHRRRGLHARPFDGDGTRNQRTALVEDGVLQTWILDLRSARQLGLKSTGHGGGGGSGPSTSDVYLTPGAITPAELISDIQNGFYVTHLMGMGVNGVTGDYSRGAAGFWIENGEIAYPVSEMTIASNLNQMFLNLTPANDLIFKTGSDAPTLRIDGMTVAGA